MKIFGKSLKEYIAVVWMYFILGVIIMAAATVLRLNNAYSTDTENIVTLLGVAIIIWAGVSAVKEHGFNLLQTAFVGFLISLAATWSLPIFHPPLEALYLFIVNSILYALAATASGWIAKRIFKRK